MNPSFFFSSPTKTLLAEDDGEAIAGCLREREALLAAAEAAARYGSRRLVGAVPFGELTPVRLFCPTHVKEHGRWATLTVKTTLTEGREAGSHAEQTEPFLLAVRAAVDSIQRGDLRKVVLSRARQVQLGHRPEVGHLLRSLRGRNPHGFTFALSLASAAEPERMLVGASPELLVSRRGERVVSAPLAGSLPRSADAREDRERAAQLLRSPKDRHEHRLVVDEILASLQPFVRNLRFEREPVVTSTPAMWHLSTRIEGTLKDPSVSSLRLALSLHPTPAVCGTPTSEARQFIAHSESFDRGYFTGTLGHMSPDGDGDWIVTIRCAELAGERATVFAGAGIVESSDAELELRETDAKMRTMLDVLGLGGVA